ncbi:uncharacterized protein N7479_002066 [Penicillium vulpinum]|uniref:SET domain-containing protein n=1 Tax=Penicillium vulpinum TaxID=29845 RepID=A0A1V6S4W2_9EURO|nr:uncharacterized protein N7479_002066 [Penicillium vulpinum]KAJ5972148.1 hypothetical protein N7479_002066 [Penicillium vulpinum]OQE08896.1 hypothetical protein PENVUL_c008G02272 [Penicillium vulpinum]
MGSYMGFDMVPRLSEGLVHKQNWQKFLNAIKERYQNDDQVEVKPNYIAFKADPDLLLPFECHKFLRFGAMIPNEDSSGLRNYIDTVSRVAGVSFGSRGYCWNEGSGVLGFYAWDDVKRSIRSYEQFDEPEMPTTIAQLVLGTDPISELGLPLYKAQPVLGKGQGLVARFNIAKGQLIISEKPFFTTSKIASATTMEKQMAIELRKLSKNAQRQFLSLHNNFPGKQPFSGIVRTNALPCGSESPIGGVYPTISRINHSCLPNAHNSWNSESGYENIHAVRFISAGEEITIPYDHGGTSDERRRYLKDAFGFDCDCSICSRQPTELKQSDERRRQIQRLDAAIGDGLRVMYSPKDCLRDCRVLLQVLEEEYEGSHGAHLARLYYDAFQVSIVHGDQARAGVFAERSYRARAACEGEDNPETKRIRILMEDPKRHGSFGLSMKWKSLKDQVPRGLSAYGFEGWLWTGK